MNKSSLFLAVLGAVAAVLIGCDEKRFPTVPGNPADKDTTVVNPVVGIDTTQAISLEDAKLRVGEQVTVVGYVTNAYAPSNKYEKLTQSAWLAATPTATQGVVEAYYCEITDTVAKGDYVAVQGKMDIYVKSNTTDTTFEIKDGVMQIIRRAEPDTVTPPTALEGDGTMENPYTVSDVILLNNSKSGVFYVKGYIVGCIKKDSKTMEGNVALSGFDSETNIVIAAAAEETTESRMVPVQLPSGTLRTGLNLVANAGNLGQEVLLLGSLEAYFGVAGVKSITYAKLGDTEVGTKPVQPTGEELLNEPLNTQASFGKFTAQSVSGEQVWTLSTSYGATMSGYANNASHANEDWLVSPAFDATGRTPVLTFEHARGPKGSMSISTDNFTVWVSNDYTDDVTTATWTQIAIPTHGSTAWGYVSSGEMTIPAANCAANCRIAWKYTCTDSASATWEIKNVLVK